MSTNQSGAPGSTRPNPDDVLKVLVATDIHLGYGEKTPVKAEDSYITFNEILKIGVDEGVDMVLLGGDLFHENKPSRLAEKKCLSILRKHVLGDRPIALELLSDPEVNFSHCDEGDRHVNYADPNMNIGMPIFSIHGNHDDPVGLGGLSALDNIHATGLVNYFGRINNLQEITVTPLLLRKGITKLAMYGLSSVKDERLYRLFREGRVHMLRPEEETESWFNLLVLHQNRAKHGPSNYIPEHFIDGFFDLVVWGHEHECRLTPEHIFCGDTKEFHISQPGSSVATSLCEGEAKEKRVGILEIYGQKFKMTEKPLKTVRPMIFRTISLEEEIDLHSGHLSDKKLTEKIEKFLKTYVEKLLQEEVPKLLTGHPEQPKLPQVRVRVEYSDERHQLSAGRFGNHFHDKVANPSEILLFKKRVERSEKREDNFEPDLMGNILAQNLETCSSIEELIGKYFTKSEDKCQLHLLGIRSIGTAVKAFINKEDKDAIGVIIENQVNKISQALIQSDISVEDVDDELERFRKKRNAEAGKEEKDAEAALVDEDARKTATSKKKTDFEDSDQEIDDNGQENGNGWTPTGITRGRGRGRAAARGGRGRGRGKAAQAVDDSVNDDLMNGASRRSGRASPAKTTRARGGRGSRKAPLLSTQSTQQSISSMFSKQNQSLRAKRAPVLYDSDSD